MGNKGLGSDDSHKYELITESTPDNYLDVTLDWDFWYEDEKPHLDGDDSYDNEKEWRGNITLMTDKIKFCTQRCNLSLRTISAFPVAAEKVLLAQVKVLWKDLSASLKKNYN